MKGETGTSTEVFRTVVQDILDDHAGESWPLIAVLQEIQHRIGYIPPEVVPLVADRLGIFPGEIQGVITFYSQLRDRPQGRTVIRACRGTACHVSGGTTVLKALQGELGISEGESTADRQYSLETVACVGACGLAPNVIVDDDVFGTMTPAKVRKLIEKDGEPS